MTRGQISDVGPHVPVNPPYSMSDLSEDRATQRPGEAAKVVVGSDASGHVRLVGSNGSTVKSITTTRKGDYTHEHTTLPNQPGRYTLMVGEAEVDSITVDQTGESDQSLSDPNVGDTSPAFNDSEPGPDIDPANYAGIVNADNDEGVALAPALRREGASLGPDGATVTLPDGETVDVGAIEEADEVARVLEGENAGDVIEADQPAVDGDPSSSSGGSGPDSGVIGAVGVGIVLLLAGAAALLGGT